MAEAKEKIANFTKIYDEMKKTGNKTDWFTDVIVDYYEGDYHQQKLKEITDMQAQIHAILKTEYDTLIAAGTVTANPRTDKLNPDPFPDVDKTALTCKYPTTVALTAHELEFELWYND